MSDNKPNPQTPSNMPTQFDREAELALMTDHIAKVQAEHPDQDLKMSSQWWTPLIDLKANMQELDPETTQKVNNVVMKAFASKFDPAVLKGVREELETLLSGQHEELLKIVNSTIFANPNGLARMREHVQAEGNQGAFSAEAP